jgi:serine/threonine-protein kinase
MATVFLAQDLKHGRRVAIKVLRPEIAVPLGAERFLREIEIAARLTHPHILPLYDSGKADPFLYYVMPFVEGASLRGRLNGERQLPVADAVQITREVADALNYAHSHNVVHRDIKPENILFQAGHAVVSDFGIARAVAMAESDTMTQAGLSLGTPAYMSPEQAAGEKELDARTDLYSLACVLYEMLAGEPPFVGPTAAAVIGRRFTAPPPAIDRKRADTPASVTQALARALAQDPADRFESTAQFAEALTRGATLGTAVRAAATGRSIAVLPFSNLSADPDNEYFSEGITEEIINALARVPGLQVAARSSSFAFKGKSVELAEIGSKLSVATVLEGSVRRAGNRVRVTAQLADVTNGYQLWSERYDQELGDIFAIQDAIARSIAHRLELTLSEPARGGGAPVKPRTPNVEAYELYLKGRYFWNQRGTGITKALACFEQALAIDEHFAQAHAGVADALTLLAFYAFRRPTEVMPRAKVAAERALALDDTIAEAHTSIGLIQWLYDWNWAAAELELRRAIALNPRYVVARYWYAAFCATRLRLEEAIAEDERAVALEPLSVFANLQLGMVLLAAGRSRSAVDQVRKAIELDPHFALAHWMLGCTHAAESRYLEALPELEAAVKLSHSLPSMVAALAGGYAEAGRTEDARRLLGELRARAGQEYVSLGCVAAVSAALGDTDEALRLLEQAHAERDVSLPFLRDRVPTAAAFGFPLSTRSDPRYQTLLQQIGLGDQRRGRPPR